MSSRQPSAEPLGFANWAVVSADFTPEERLWLGVIRQAIIDLSLSDRDTYSKSPRLDRDRARTWLTGGSKDFREVCEAAGVDPDVLRKMAVDGTLDKVSVSIRMTRHGSPRDKRARRAP